MKYTTVGVDIAENVFQLHWVETGTDKLVNKQMKRAAFLEHFANREPCLIGMAAYSIATLRIPLGLRLMRRWHSSCLAEDCAIIMYDQAAHRSPFEKRVERFLGSLSNVDISHFGGFSHQ